MVERKMQTGPTPPERIKEIIQSNQGVMSVRDATEAELGQLVGMAGSVGGRLSYVANTDGTQGYTARVELESAE